MEQRAILRNALAVLPSSWQVAFCSGAQLAKREVHKLAHDWPYAAATLRLDAGGQHALGCA